MLDEEIDDETELVKTLLYWVCILQYDLVSVRERFQDLKTFAECTREDVLLNEKVVEWKVE